MPKSCRKEKPDLDSIVRSFLLALWPIVTSSTIDIFFEIIKFSKILLKFTFISNILSKFDKIFEIFRKKCQFRKYFRKFCYFEKSAMINEVNIRVTWVNE